MCTKYPSDRRSSAVASGSRIENSHMIELASAQLDRPLRSPCRVVIRCHLGLPVVLEVGPILEDGTPFPTRYWLSCPLAVKRIGRLEAASYIEKMTERVRSDPDFATALQEAHEQYRRERDSELPPDYRGPRPRGGIAGALPADAIKCLHAHYAHWLARGTNPVGAAIAPLVEPLNCDVPCVEVVSPQQGSAEVRARRNPRWREPAQPRPQPSKSPAEVEDKSQTNCNSGGSPCESES
jgi:hypothetical protein